MSDNDESNSNIGTSAKSVLKTSVMWASLPLLSLPIANLFLWRFPLSPHPMFGRNTPMFLAIAGVLAVIAVIAAKRRTRSTLTPVLVALLSPFLLYAFGIALALMSLAFTGWPGPL